MSQPDTFSPIASWPTSFIEQRLTELESQPPCTQCGDTICWCDGMWSDANIYGFLVQEMHRRESSTNPTSHHE